MTQAQPEFPHRRAAVLGHPVAHSLSPAIHRAGYRFLGLGWTYEAIDCTQAGLSAALQRDDPTWVGWSLTMPLKETAVGLVDEVEPLAEQVRAVNTVLTADGRLLGHNTDICGLAVLIRELGAARAGTVTLLGAGATARSALAALAGCSVGQVVVFARRPDAARELQQLAKPLGLQLHTRSWDEAESGMGAELVVSTVPSGAADQLAAQIHEGAVGVRGALVDVLYAPWPSPLATAWHEAGGAVAGGVELLVQQAAGQLRLMTGRDVPVPVLRDAAEAALLRPR